MRSKEEIIKKIEELQQDELNNDLELTYLKLALEKDESALELLFIKYRFEIEDDIPRANALAWALGIEEKFSWQHVS